MKIIPSLLFLALLPVPVLADPADEQADDLLRAVFDNRSSTAVTVYRRDSFYTFNAVRRVGPGEAFAAPTEEGDEWLASTPAYYRPVKYLRVSARERRAVITDDDHEAIGTRKLAVQWVNRTGEPVDLYKVVGRDAVHWSRLDRGETRSIASYAGREWVAREAASGRLVDRVTMGAESRSVLLDLRGPGLGIRDRSPQTAGEASIELTIRNRTARAISVARKTRFGSRTFGQVAPWGAARVQTLPGEVWRLEDAETYEVLDTITVAEGRGDCTLLVAPGGSVTPSWEDPEPPRPPAVVELRVENSSSRRIDVFRERDGAMQHARRINPGRSWEIGFTEGQRGEVRAVEDGDLLESFTAPDGGWTLRVEDPPVAEVADDVPPDDEGWNGPPRPRELLRRILRRE